MRDRHARHRRPDSDPRRRPIDGFRVTSAARFDRIVRDAVGSLPPPLLRFLDGVHIAIGELPPVAPEGEDDAIRLSTYADGRDAGPETADLPPADRIILYRRPLEARARNQHDLIELIRETVVHELADHHDLGDDQLGDLGWT